MDEIENIDQPHLSISAHVVVQLGEELVTDKEQSILELVKNCYDADATDCDIYIDPDWKIDPTQDPDLYFCLFPEHRNEHESELESLNNNFPIKTVGRIVIEDDGEGMSDETVRNSWLRISSSSKRPTRGEVKTITKGGRTPVGDKGLGRLATMKLGKVIYLTTTQQGEGQKRSIWFSWGDFTEDRELAEVPVHTVPPVPKNDAGEKGSSIEIIGLKELDRWNQDSLVSKELVSNLSKLVSPFLEKKGFLINIHYRDHCYEISHLSDEALNLASCAYHWSWEDGVMHHSGRISESLFFGTGRGRAREDFNRVFLDKTVRRGFIEHLLANKKLKEFNLQPDASPGLFTFVYKDDVGESLPQTRGYSRTKNPGPFRAAIYDFNLSHSSRQALSAVGATADLIKSTNIQIFRDGFLVRYEGDWLEISQGQTGGSSYYGLRPGNTIGYFDISNRVNFRLIEKSDREAFVDNEEFRGFLFLARRAKEKENTLRELLRREYTEFLRNLTSDKIPTPSPTEAAKVAKKSLSKDGKMLSNAIKSLEEVVDLSNKQGRRIH